MGLILLRHTRPVVEPGVCYGRTDIDCADGFVDEAAVVVADLPEFDRLLTSPLLRCQRLADAIAMASGVPIEIDDRLAEMDFGTWEGRPWDDIPRDEIDAWAADFHGSRVHGGESVAALAARVDAALGDIRSTGGTPLIVTHNGVIRAALAAGGRADAWTFSLPYGACIEI